MTNSTSSPPSARPGEAGQAEAALAPTLQGLRAQDKDIQVFAARKLAAMARDGAPVVDRLMELLAGPELRTRWGAAYALSLIEDALDLRSQPAIIAAMRTPDGDVRWAAAGLMVRLGKLYPAQVRRSLLELLAQEEPHGRKMALYCLRDLDAAGHAVTTAIDAACGAADIQVRLAALALVKHLLTKEGGEPRPAQLITRAIEILEHDPDHGVRRAAADVLGAIPEPPPAAYEALARAAGSGDQSLRKIAARALNHRL